MELETIHLTTLAVTAAAVLYSDHLGYQYFRGKRSTLDPALTHWLHTVVLIGLLLMIASGTILTMPVWEYVASEPLFYVKMGMVLVLVFNSWVIGTMSGVAAERSFRELPQKTQVVMLVSGGLSIAGWIGATVLSFLFF